jgi:hypothetical protein
MERVSASSRIPIKSSTDSSITVNLKDKASSTLQPETTT